MSKQLLTNAADAQAQIVFRVIRSASLPITNEKETQGEVETLLKAHSLTYTREYRLNKKDIPDFFFTETGLVLEIKLRGQRKVSIYKQLERYAKHDEVTVIMLATNVCMGMPSLIEGKPVYYISLGEAWL